MKKPNSRNMGTDFKANNNRMFFGLLCLGFILHVSCVLILSSVPPISRDALIHHLVIPKVYLLHGGIYEIPHMFFSYFPMNVDLLYIVPLYFGNDIAPKYIHFLFALLTAGLIFRYLKKELNTIYGMIGALFFLTIPIIVKLSVTVYVDLGLIFFSWATLYYFLKWYDTNFRFRYLMISGIFCGLALGTKYNGLILLPIMGVLVAMGFSLEQNRKIKKTETRIRNINSLHGIKWGTLFLLISLVVFSPWMIRNMIWKQNPVYPLFNNVFNPPAPVLISSGDTNADAKEEPRNAFWIRRHVYEESFLETILIPVRAFFQGQDDQPKYFDGKLNPFLLFLPIIALVRRRDEQDASRWRTHKIIFLVFSSLFTVFVLFQHDFRIRYMSPAIPPLIILAVFGLKNIMEISSQQTALNKKIMMSGAAAVMALAFLYNANYIYGQFDYIRPFDFLSGKVDRDSYISRYRTEHAVIVYANKTLPMDAKVLCLSIGDRTYYLNRSAHLAGDFYNRQNGTFSSEDLVKKLKRHDTTHVILHKEPFFDWLRTLDKSESKVFLNVFQRNTKTLYERNGVLLLEVIQS